LPCDHRYTWGLTFRPVPSSIPQEQGMGTMGLALLWEHRIPPVPIGSGGCQLQLTDSNGSIEIAKAP
jgi:hypothetical protein